MKLIYILKGEKMEYYKREILDRIGEISIDASEFKFDLFTIVGLIWLSPVLLLLSLAFVLFLIMSFPVAVIGELLGKY